MQRLRSPRIFPVLLSVLCAVLLLVLILQLLIPAYLESRLIPRAAKSAGLGELSCDVRHIGLFGADLAHVRIGDADNPSVLLGSVQLDYSPTVLLSGHLKRVVCNGLELHAEHANGKFSIRGLDLNKLFPRAQPEDDLSTSPDTGPAFPAGSVEILNSAILLEWNGQRIRLPMAMKLVPESDDWGLLAAVLDLYPRGHRLSFSASIDLNAKNASLHFEAAALRLERFSDFTRALPKLSFSGTASIDGRAEIDLKPFKISAAKAVASFRETRATYNSIPVPIAIGAVHCDVNASHDALGIAGNVGLVVKPPEGGNPFSVAVVQPIPLALGFSATRTGTGDWEFRVASKSGSKPMQAGKAIRLERNGLKITAANPKVEISGSVMRGKGTAACTVAIPAIRAIAEQTTVKVPRLLLEGEARFGDSAEGDPFQAALAINVEDAAISNTKVGAAAGEINASIPIQWPAKGSGAKGRISVKKMQWKELELGSIEGEVRQDGKAFLLQAKHLSLPFPGLSLEIEGKAGLSTGHRPLEIDFSVKNYRTKTDVDLGQFTPSASGMMLSGQIAAQGNLTSTASGVESTLSLDLKDATVHSDERNLAIDGIELSLFLPDLLNLHSAPEQQLSFRRVELGGLNAADGRIDFEIESPDSLFIETARVKWCNGNLSTHAIRVVPGVDEYDLIVYCDRLQLAELLEQVASFEATGEGTVNGRIPVSLRGGQILFSDGFLYSTPGSGGNIRLKGTEVLTAGIPANTPQFAQLDLTSEALKDYDYEWVKLNLLTEEGILALGMQLDGKPVRPLPFVYRKEVGGFARVEAGSKGSEFEGIALDVNLRVPLDKLLHYGENINDILELSQ